MALAVGEASVIGRDQELRAIRVFLANVDGPGALVLSGEAGIGKTVLWEAGVEEAERRFGRVLAHRSVESEASLSFAGLSDVLDGVVEEVAPSLLPPRRRALEVALLMTEPGAEAPDQRAIGLAVRDVLHLLAERRPVVVALDDSQWLDPSSGIVLRIALRRLRSERVGLLASRRHAAETTAGVELERSFPEERIGRVSLGPISLAALHSLLKQRLGLELTRPELVRVAQATAGNPFFALELGRELVRTGTRPEPGRPLRVPDSLSELLGGRLARLPAETVDVLLPAAAMAWPSIELIAAACGDDEILDTLDPAVREGVIVLDEEHVRFSHPMLASICTEQAPARKRRAVHRKLAALVTDPEERARHAALAAEAPDPTIASALDLAAGRAAARGATAAAAELLELAAGLTPASDGALSRRRRLSAADFHRLAGDSERATMLLEQLREEAPPGADRADVLLALALTFTADRPSAIALLNEALLDAQGDDSRAARILTYRAVFDLAGVDVRAALDAARAALEKVERAGDEAGLAVAIARLGTGEMYAGEITPGLLERGVAIEERLGLPLDYFDSPRCALARQLMYLGSSTGRVAFSTSFRPPPEPGGTRALGRWRSGGCRCSSGSPVAGSSRSAIRSRHMSSPSRRSTLMPASGRGGPRRWSRPTSAWSTTRGRPSRRRSPSHGRARTRSTPSSASACSAASSSLWETCTRREHTCASFPDACSTAG